MIPLKLIDRVILFFFYSLLFIDTINGILIRSGIIGISSPIKFLLLGLMLVRIFSFSVERGVLMFTMFFLLSIPCFSSFFFVYSDVSVLFADLTIVFRYMLIPVSFLYGTKLFSQLEETLRTEQFSKFININTFFLLLNLFVGALGFGYSQYEGGVGSVGYFYAGNEVSAVMIVLFSFVASNLYKRYSVWKYILFGSVLVVFSLIKATKVGIVGTLLLLIAIPLLMNTYKISRWIKLKKISLFIALGVILLGLSYYLYVYLTNSQLMNRLIYFYDNSESLMNFLLSGRDSFVKDGLEEYYKYNAFEMAFGVGFTKAIGLAIQYVGSFKSTEIDFFDFLFQHGIIGVLLVYGFHFYLLTRSFYYVCKYRSALTTACLVSNLLILLISLSAGHVFNAGMSGVFIGLTNSILQPQNNE